VRGALRSAVTVAVQLLNPPWPGALRGELRGISQSRFSGFVTDVISSPDQGHKLIQFNHPVPSKIRVGNHPLHLLMVVNSTAENRPEVSDRNRTRPIDVKQAERVLPVWFCR
jgi:hypothetical protein